MILLGLSVKTGKERQVRGELVNGEEDHRLRQGVEEMKGWELLDDCKQNKCRGATAADTRYRHGVAQGLHANYAGGRGKSGRT